MSRLVLVRHAEASAAWGDGADTDPGLSHRGRAQAEAMADSLAPTGPLPIVVSPLRRTRETAAPLEARWGVTARVEPAVGEVPAPAGGDRVAWLAGLLATPTDDWPPEIQQWREAMLGALHAIGEDAIVVTHYVAITVATGARPDHCSLTMLETP